MSEILDAALGYAARGWRVFPAKGKIPLVPHGCLDATADFLDVSYWFHQQFPDANIGVATGAESGLVVLDVDAGHGGFESLSEMVARYKTMPRTPEVVTGGGGAHFYFKHPGGTVGNKTGVGRYPGLDIRGDGGYVIAPPSGHASGAKYEWSVEAHIDGLPLGEVPHWLLKLCEERRSPRPVAGDPISDGRRNDTLCQIAGSMRRWGLSSAAIYAALAVHNEEICTPPLPDDEVYRIAESIVRYEPARDSSGSEIMLEGV